MGFLRKTSCEIEAWCVRCAILRLNFVNVLRQHVEVEITYTTDKYRN